MKENTTISICKALAIILMVIGHADCPSVLSNFLYEFHMPLFFMASGYFFSLRYLDDEATFLKKRLRGLYLPFLKWSLVFLILHNFMFSIGVLNEQYGNWSGGVTHPYTWHQACQRLWNMVSAMGGYDEFLLGAFWFFRGLLVASVLYLVLFKLVRRGVKFILSRSTTWQQQLSGQRLVVTQALLVCLVALLIAAWKTSEGLKVITLVQGGYREIMGCFFFSCGFLLRQWQHYYRPTWWNSLLFFCVVALFSVYLTSNMNWRSSFEQFLSLPLPAICGCLLTYNVASYADRFTTSPLRRFFVYLGNHTLVVFVFHIISYKAVNPLKILYYDLDWAQMGCHMVIHEHASDDIFWLLYTVAGVGIPITLQWLWDQRFRLKTFSKTS